MLSESKENAIVQWHNCIYSSSNLSSLSELSDGDILRKDLQEIFEYEVRPLPSSSKSISFKKDSEAKENFEYVKKYIDESLQLKSEDLVSYEECANGNKMEIAMVTVMALTVTVRHRLESVVDARCLLLHLDVVTQLEIVECMQLVIEHPDKELRRVEFHRILSRTTNLKERSIRLSPVKAKTAPRKYGRRSKKVSSDSPSIAAVALSDDSPSPVIKMLQSPQVKVWSTTAAKERELFNLRRDLDAAENKIIDQRCHIAELRKDLDSKDEEYQNLKTRFRKMQDDMDDIVLRNQSMDEKMSMGDMSKIKVVEICKTEISFLKQQVEAWKSTSEELRLKLEHQQQKAKESPSPEQLYEVELQLQLTQQEKGRLAQEVETLQENLKELQEIVSVYKDKLQERERLSDTSTIIDMTSENVADIITQDYEKMREKLLNEELQNARLRKQLQAKTAAYKELEAQLKCRSLEDSISPKFHDSLSDNVFLEPSPANAIKTEKQVAVFPFHPGVPFQVSSRSCCIENGKEASGRLWEQNNMDTGNEGTEAENGSSMKEIVLLAKQVFAAYGEARTLEVPNGLDPGNGASYVKYLLQELVREGKSDTEKSEEVSLDSGVNLCTLPTVQEGESREQRSTELLRECDQLRVRLNDLDSEKQKMLEENASLRNLCKDTMKLKDEYEKRITQLTEKYSEVSNKLSKSERDLAGISGQMKYCCKKYARLKAYVLETEERLRASLEEYGIAESQRKAKHDQVLQLESKMKDLQAFLVQERNSHSRLSSRLDCMQQTRQQLQDEKDAMEVELASQRAKNKELLAEIQALKTALKRRAWNMPPEQEKISIDVELGENGDDTKSSYVRVNAAFPGKRNNDSVLSGGAFNKSLHSTFVNEDEEDMLNHTGLPSMEDEVERLKELEHRNSLYLPHMRSHYALETQVDMDMDKDKGKDKGEASGSSKRLPGIFKTPKSLHLMVQKMEDEKKRLAGIKRPRLKL